MLPRKRVLTTTITVGSFERHIELIADYGLAHRSSYVCCVNAHMTVEARDPEFAKVVQGADFATADGMPVVLSLRWLQGIVQERVAGNDILPALLKKSAEMDLSVYLYGGTEQVQQQIRDRALREFPSIRFAGGYSPPFGTLEALDPMVEAERINGCNAHVVLVSLGCPKQERWMAMMKGRVNGVMLGLGGAFLLYAGVDSRAPAWMRRLSLEWLYRLCLEPRRLWKRYLVTNSIFVCMFLKEFLKQLVHRPLASTKSEDPSA